MTARHAAISDQLFQPLVAIIKAKESRWNRYRVWKPLSLMVLLGVTSREWDISIVEENLGAQDYEAMPRPDLAGITVFISQVNRTMKWPLTFGVWVYPPCTMGGIHATMCLEEGHEVC